jgi:uncharacterized protein YjbJ (UPF0337 family)
VAAGPGGGIGCRPAAVHGKGTSVSGKGDIAKGRIKEAAGVLTGNDKLRNTGQTDQKVGRIKLAAAKATDRVVERMRK